MVGGLLVSSVPLRVYYGLIRRVTRCFSFFFNNAQINNPRLESHFPQNQTPKTINRYPFNKKEYTTLTNEEEPSTIHTNIRRSCPPPRDTSVLDSGQPNHKPRKDLKKMEDVNNWYHEKVSAMGSASPVATCWRFWLIFYIHAFDVLPRYVHVKAWDC